MFADPQQDQHAVRRERIDEAFKVDEPVRDPRVGPRVIPIVIAIDPIGNDPLDLSDAPPKQGPGPNRTILGWTATATTFFIAAVVLGVIMVAVIAILAGRS